MVLDLEFSEEFQIENCCYFNWWVFSDQTVTQGRHWVKHHMFGQMPLLVDQIDFWKSFNNDPNLNSNSNRKNSRQVLDPKFKLKLESSFYVLDLSSYPTLDTSV
jgi:hypothetical protein